MRQAELVQVILICSMSPRSRFFLALSFAVLVHVVAVPFMAWMGWVCPARLLGDRMVEAGVTVSFVTISQAEVAEQFLTEPLALEAFEEPVEPPAEELIDQQFSDIVSEVELSEFHAPPDHLPAQEALAVEQSQSVVTENEFAPKFEAPKSAPKSEARRKQSSPGISSDVAKPAQVPQKIFDQDPLLLSSPKPPYPAEARKQGVEGSVLLRVKIDNTGRVSRADVVRSSGRDDFDSAALHTVTTRWRFRPARLAGVAVESERTVSVDFRLR